MKSFAERVGGVLTNPSAALTRVASGEGGLSDVTALLCLRIAAGETPQIARAVFALRHLGLGPALQQLVQTVSTVLPDVLGILIGGVALSLFRGAGASTHGVDGAKEARPAWAKGRELDLAAVAWIPYLAVKVVYALLFTALQRPALPVEEHVFDAIAVGWSVAVWARALWLLRSGAPSTIPSEGA